MSDQMEWLEKQQGQDAARLRQTREEIQAILNAAVDESPCEWYAPYMEAVEMLGGERLLRREAEKAAAKHAHDIDVFRALAVDWAAQLALVGGQDHKTKNEMILRVIARMLAVGVGRPENPAGEDLPF